MEQQQRNLLGKELCWAVACNASQTQVDGLLLCCATW